MRHSDFLIFSLLLVFCGPTHAAPIGAERITNEVKSFIGHTLIEENSNSAIDYSVSVSNLDARLQLEECNRPLDMKIASPNNRSRNISVKVTCKSPKRWSIYVPVRIEERAQVTVLSRSLPRGTVLREEDISLTKMDLSRAGYGYVLDPANVIGKELKRALQAGESVRISHLKQPELVKRGEKVIMEAVNQRISVVTTGRALDAGQLGDQIKVQNGASERIVEAIVIAPGRVRIDL